MTRSSFQINPNTLVQIECASFTVVADTRPGRTGEDDRPIATSLSTLPVTNYPKTTGQQPVLALENVRITHHVTA
jgi:hypothetical protein